MPSSFFNRSPLNVVTPFKYSIGLFNIVEGELMEFFYKYTMQSPTCELRSFPFQGTKGEENIEDLSGDK